MPRADGTVTPAEHAVLEVLRDGAALLGAETNAALRLVESRATRRLAAAGLVVLRHGEARLAG